MCLLDTIRRLCGSKPPCSAWTRPNMDEWRMTKVVTDRYSIEIRDADMGVTVVRVDADWTDQDRRTAIALIRRLV